MAERSFAKEVRDLELGDGQEFRGEGILAITKALLQSGVGYVGGYQGAPISHLMDVLADARTRWQSLASSSPRRRPKRRLPRPSPPR
jgi:TPP-dependent indolepyruvate ferredoxin oxidoreductase alpha subunit